MSRIASALSGSRLASPLIVSVSYRKRLTTTFLDFAGQRGLAINFHPSLLPKHKGCMSGVHTILDGDVEAGVTCHHMVRSVAPGPTSHAPSPSHCNPSWRAEFSFPRVIEKFDAGKIIHQEMLQLTGSETAKSLYASLLAVEDMCFVKVMSDYFSRGEFSPNTLRGVSAVRRGTYHSRKLPHEGLIAPE